MEVLGNLTELESTRSLARHAVMAPWESVRKAASDKLKSRPQEDYIPALLGEMYSPLRSQADVEQDIAAYRQPVPAPGPRPRRVT